MKEPSNQPPPPMSMEEGIHEMLCSARECVREQHQKCEKRIRKSPTSAMIGAVAVGYLLHRLPVRAILITKIRVLSALMPPALFVFSAAKLYDAFQKRESAKRE